MRYVLAKALIAGILCLVMAVPLRAQQTLPTALVADRVTYDPVKERLIASGNVQVIFDGQVLNASRITYESATGLIFAEGPLVIKTDDDVRIVANSADLDTKLETALIRGARLVLAQNFQFAAAEARRDGDRYLTLYKTVASACQVCAANPTPVWMIRADKVVRDAQALQIHVENAYFDVMGVTVAYLPYFRFPDPSVTRASGFLEPSLRSSDLAGTGIKIPYFWAIGEDRDATITPVLMTGGALLLEGEYRQALQNGTYRIEGSVALSDGQASTGIRGHLRAEALFQLAPTDRLNIKIDATTDKSYLSTFGYSQTDRLRNEITWSRQNASQYTEVAAVAYQSLRDNEVPETVPFLLPDIQHRQYWTDTRFGGRFSFDAGASAMVRIKGRDVAKASAGLTWARRFVLPAGFIAQTVVGAESRVAITHDDPNFPTSPQALFIPLAGAELRWPLARQTEKALHVIEPVAQIVYSDIIGNETNIPNEDSVQVEFDAANLFSLNRFPGTDRTENGFRLNLGVNYTRIDPDGWQMAFTLGQVLRAETTSGFSDGAGLNGVTSNIVAAGVLDLPPYLTLSNQTLFDESLQFYRNDIQARIEYGDLALDAAYVFLAPDITEGALTERHELVVAANYQLTPEWLLNAGWRRDLSLDQNVSADAALEFRNECVTTRFSVSRRFRDSNNVPESTNYGLNIALAGFGGGQKQASPNRCVNLGQ